MTDVVDKQRDQLLRELVGAVVVRAIGDDGRQAVGIVESAHKVVARGLGSAVGAMRLVFQVFSEEFVAKSQMVLATAGLGAERWFNAFGVSQLESTIDLIGGNMIKTARNAGP